MNRIDCNRRSPRGVLLTAFAVMAVLSSCPISQLAAQGLPPSLAKAPNAKAKGAKSPAGVQEKEPGPSLEERHQEVLARLKHAQLAVAEFQSETEAPQHLLRELELLKWLDLLHSERKSALKRKSDRVAELREIRANVGSLQSLGLPKDQQYSFLALDEILEQLATEHHRGNAIQMGLDAAEESIASAKQSLEDEEKRRRSLREAYQAEEEPAKRDKLTRDHGLAKLTSWALAESVKQRELRVEIGELELEISGQRAIFLRQKADHLAGRVQFSKQDLAQKLADLSTAESGLHKTVAELQAESSDVDQRWLEAQRAFKDSVEESPAAAEEVVSWRLIRDLKQDEISLYKRMLAHVGLIRTIWERRYALANGFHSPTELSAWDEEASAAHEELERIKQLIQLRNDSYLGDLTTLNRRMLRVEKSDPEVQKWLRRQEEELGNAISGSRAQLVLLTAAGRVLDRFADEVEQAQSGTSLADSLASVWQWLRGSWRYEITSVDDRPITIGKIVSGLALLLIGAFLSRLFSRTLGDRVLPRFGMNQGASMAFQSISFYLLLTCFGFLALEMINLPLTVFAFMGGAVAIGVGFGSQNVVNNFISGLILLAEQPIRAGDLVDIGGLNGTIQHIGARSTRVRTGSNLEIIVPNSTFLETNVTNWTLSDTRSRTMVSVGVAYGSPVREVKRLLGEAVNETAGVLSSPDPIVLFKEFADNSLIFEVHFWIHMRTVMDREKITSEVRFALDEQFNQAGITIAFPQRDVHIDSLAPIEVNLRTLQQGALDDVSRKNAA